MTIEVNLQNIIGEKVSVSFFFDVLSDKWRGLMADSLL